MSSPVSVLFSDLDGTLVHYPKELESYATITVTSPATATITYNSSGETRTCKTLTSKTGGDSYISDRTFQLIQELRDLGVKFVIITGARSSTYIKRRPILPHADFEFFENGGRKLVNGELDAAWTNQFEKQIGRIDEERKWLPNLPVIEQREGTLWQLCQKLTTDGWKVDTREYLTNFRVDVAKTNNKTAEDFKKIVEEEVQVRGLATSFNLGKADFYPNGSGKANAARHVLQVLGLHREEAVAMFDDDNDIELGRLCGKSFLPGVTHESVLKELEVQPSWQLMEEKGVLGTEKALEAIIELKKKSMS